MQDDAPSHLAGSEDDDQRLAARARGGDLRAFEALVRRYERWVFTLALRLVGERSEAEDMAQEIFLKAYAGLAGFRGAARFSTWLYAIATHHCLNHLAARRRRAHLEISPEAPGGSQDQSPSAVERAADGGPGPDALLEQREIQQAVRAALALLSDEHRVILLLREIQGLTYEEIAETLGLEMGTVRSRLYRARQELRKCLGPAALYGSRP